MDKGTARPATGRGVVTYKTSDPHPALAPEPVKWRRTFPGHPLQLSLMRRWLKLLLPDCAALDDVLAVANELATNAVCHTLSGQGGWFAVEVARAPELVRVAVADQGGPSVPALSDGPDGEHGRGLAVVQALSTRTGLAGDANGRQVWADIAFDASK